MLLQNITLNAQYPLRFVGATATATQAGNTRYQLGINASNMLAAHASAADWDKQMGFPSGAQFGNGWMLPQSDGGAWLANLGTASGLDGVGTFASHGALGLNGVAPLVGSAALDMDIKALVSGVGSMDGAGSVAAALSALADIVVALSGETVVGADVTGAANGTAGMAGVGALNGALGAVLDAIAALAGSGAISDAQADSIISAVASILGSGSLTADVIGLFPAEAGLSGIGSLSAAVNSIGNAIAALMGTGLAVSDIYALGNMEGSVQPFTELSPQSLADAVLDSEMENGLTVRQALRLIAAATAGKVSGAETATVTIRSAVADDADRIVATVDGDGNRTAITYDLD